MENERQKPQQQQPGTESSENEGQVHDVQFNELSEINLEARMNVADHMGVPVNNLGDAAALGTMRDRDNAAEGSNEALEKENRSEETDR